MMMGTALRAFAHPTDFLQRLGELTRTSDPGERGRSPAICRGYACIGLRAAPPWVLNPLMYPGNDRG